MIRDLPADRLSLLRPKEAGGLSSEEAAALRARFGGNAIAEQPPRRVGRLLRDAAGDPMIWFLLVISALFGVVGQWSDMIVLLAAIAPLIGMDFYLHRRTQASIEGLGSVLASTATAVRDGRAQVLPAEAIVSGDLLLVTAGQSFPADGVLIDGADLTAEESSLTGEAYPVSKRVLAPSPGSAPDPGDAHWVFAGTRLLTGSGQVRTLFTGSDTIYGQVVRSVVEGPQEQTPLQQAVTRLVKVLLVAALAICLTLAAVRLWQGFGLLDAFLSAATLAVAAIPEEFPVVLTFFLGVGVYRLARRKALVRRAVAVENIGRVDAICSDKTGTITEGRLKVAQAHPANGVTAGRLLQLAALASRPESGDPLDQALIAAGGARNAGWRPGIVFPFTEARRRETAYWRGSSGEGVLVTKGAPETVLPSCDLSAKERHDWLRKAADGSATGEKLLACAWAIRSDAPAEEPVSGFRLAGLISVSDPVRAGAREAITAARRAGIQVVMVTGDHPETAAAIARQAGIADHPAVLSGDRLAEELGTMDAAALQALDVVARASPAQKVQLVEALRRAGRIVAVTGDGVNDAPALRVADVGIAMGLRGTRSAREVSPIVLLDDNFRTIVAAIAEGRQLFANLRLSFAFLLMVHIPLVATAALIPFLGFPLLYLPVHIVWLELLIHPAAILGFQRLAGQMLQPEPRATRFFSFGAWLTILGTGGAATAAVLALFLVAIGQGESADHARSMAMTALVLSLSLLLVILTDFRSRAANAVAIAGAASAVLVPQIGMLAAVADLHPISWDEWSWAGLASCLPASVLLACRRNFSNPTS